MRKIAVLTFFENENYGTVLQAYALLRTINKFGYSCDIVDFNRNEARGGIKEALIKRMKKIGLRASIEYVVMKGFIDQRKRAFSEFKVNMPITDTQYSSMKELEALTDDYDAFVCGSDMVWSWESRDLLDIYFLKFAPKGKRVSYAPSLGNTELTNEMEDYYRSAINYIDYLSCRERSGARLIKELTGRDCEFVLDPTMLFSAKQWLEEFQISDIAKKGGNILCYMFGGMNRKFHATLDRVKDRDMRIVYVPGRFCEYVNEGRKHNLPCGPKEFIERYNEADMVVTNTFHGLIFSLIFRKPFLLIHRENGDYWKKYEERMASLLNELGISDRYIYSNDDIRRESFYLDYSIIESKLNSLIFSSRSYLENALAMASRNEKPS